jgi:hypothetical protein
LLFQQPEVARTHATSPPPLHDHPRRAPHLDQHNSNNTYIFNHQQVPTELHITQNGHLNTHNQPAAPLLYTTPARPALSAQSHARDRLCCFGACTTVCAAVAGDKEGEGGWIIFDEVCFRIVRTWHQVRFSAQVLTSRQGECVLLGAVPWVRALSGECRACWRLGFIPTRLHGLGHCSNCEDYHVKTDCVGLWRLLSNAGVRDARLDCRFELVEQRYNGIRLLRTINIDY